MKILITGANGFLGGYLVQHALQNDFQVIAAHRRNSNTDYLDSLGCTQQLLNYETPQELKTELNQLISIHGQFDYVIHNAAVTNSISKNLFHTVNVGITENLLDAIKATNFLHKKGKFALISSMAAKGPVSFNGPISEYGKSKLKAEKVVQQSKVPFIIFRPTAIYGPRDFSFLPLFKVVKYGIYPTLNPKNQKITMIHAADVAHNVLHLSANEINSIVHLDDGNVYSHTTIKKITETVVDRKSVLIHLPFLMVRLIMRIITIFAYMIQVTPSLTSEKHFEISRDWNHNFSEERNKRPLKLKYDLKSGFADTVSYYRNKNLI